MKYDIHRYDAQLVSMLRRLADDTEILAKNKKKIYEFDKHLLTLGLKDCRRAKYICLLRWLSKKLNKPYEKAKKEDIAKVVEELQSSDLSDCSKVDRKVTIKRFYKWLIGNDEFYPPEVRWIKCKLTQRYKMPEELITEEEVQQLANAADKPRDKAFIQCLYETGCRIGELLTLQLKNVTFDEHGAILRVTGKTGDRRVRIVASAPTLATWIDYHPYKTDPESYLWVRNLHKGAKDTLTMRYVNAMMLIRRLAEKAGIKKRVNPHVFRHSRATVLANKLTEAQMKEYFGWVQGSDMASVYVHLSGRDVDNAILGAYGLKNQESKELDKFKPITCSRCNATNSPGSKFCTKCGYALSVDVVLNKETLAKEPEAKNDLLTLLMKDPEFKELLVKKALERGVNKA